MITITVKRPALDELSLFGKCTAFLEDTIPPRQVVLKGQYAEYLIAKMYEAGIPVTAENCTAVVHLHYGTIVFFVRRGSHGMLQWYLEIAVRDYVSKTVNQFLESCSSD